jgi:hypothetical protein
MRLWNVAPTAARKASPPLFDELDIDLQTSAGDDAPDAAALWEQ